MGHIQLHLARNVLRVMEGTGAMENANGEIINVDLLLVLIFSVLIVMLMIQTVI